MTVHERIATALQVIAETDFNKSGQVTGGATYSFIPIGQILQAIRKAHAKAGLFLTIGQLEFDKDNGEGIFRDSNWTKARGHCEVSINGADGDCVSFTVPFNVQDNSDKLDNKIVTNIERQAYRVLYAIDEGDATDPEAEWHEDRVEATEDNFFKIPKATPKATPKAQAPKPKTAASGMDPQKAKLVDDLTRMVVAGGTNRDIIFTILGDRKLQDLDIEELRNIMDNVDPFGVGQ